MAKRPFAIPVCTVHCLICTTSTPRVLCSWHQHDYDPDSSRAPGSCLFLLVGRQDEISNSILAAFTVEPTKSSSRSGAWQLEALLKWDYGKDTVLDSSLPISSIEDGTHVEWWQRAKLNFNHSSCSSYFSSSFSSLCMSPLENGTYVKL